MDPEGYLPATLVASFNRVRSLTNDITFIMQAVQKSEVVEVKEGKLRSKTDPTSWPLLSDQPDPVISPNPEAEIDKANDKPNLPLTTNLNPNVPEFIPMGIGVKPAVASAASNAVDGSRDEDDAAGTDGDDEAEIIDHKVRTGSNSKKPGSGKKADGTDSNWVQVKSKKQDRKSMTKDSLDRKEGDDHREDLDFQFDDDLDMPAPVGRQNKFSSV